MGIPEPPLGTRPQSLNRLRHPEPPLVNRLPHDDAFDPGRKRLAQGPQVVQNRHAAARDHGNAHRIHHRAQKIEVGTDQLAVPADIGQDDAAASGRLHPLGKLDRRRVTDGIAELTAAGLMPPGLTPDQVADFTLVP